MPTANGWKPDWIVKPSELGTSGLARVMLYADNGVGKTHFLSTIPESVPTLVLNVVGENMDPLRGYDKWIATSQPIERWEQMYKEIYPFLASGKHPFKCIAFDTWTSFYVLATAQVLGLPVRSALDRLKGGAIVKANWDQLRGISELGTATMREFMQLPYHLIFLAQEETRESKLESGDIYTQPRLVNGPWALNGSPALSGTKEILKTIARLYVVSDSDADGGLTLDGAVDAKDTKSINPNRKDKRMLLIGKHDRYFTKGPATKTGYVIENPTWDKLAVGWQ